MGGQTTAKLKGGIPRYGTVWFHSGGIANTLSLSNGAEKYHVAYNITGENKFLVYPPRGEVRSFNQCDRGVLYPDMVTGQGVVLLNTVEHNKSKYSQRDYTRGLFSHHLQ